MPKARGAALEALARAVVADPAIFTPRASLDSAIAALKALPGVGEWTAQYMPAAVRTALGIQSAPPAGASSESAPQTGM